MSTPRPHLATTLMFGALSILPGCGSAEDTESDSPNEPSPSEEPHDEEDPPPVPCEWDRTLPGRSADQLFDIDHVPVFEIFLPEEKWTALQENATAEQWEEVDACFDGKYIGHIALRFKGSYGNLYGCFDETGQLICDRLSMKLKFSEFDDDMRFFGLKRLNLHANRHDDSRMREKLAYDLYRAMDIHAPRSSWGVVKVNGQSYGLYSMVEEMDGRFTDDRWPDYPDGNLYKETWPTDSDETDVLGGLKTNEEVGDVSSFVEFATAAGAAETPEDRLDVLGNYTDLDHWARYMAVDEAILSYDGVTYFYTDDGLSSHNHNYYFYEDAPSHFTLVPWDVESSFWINPDHAAPHWTIVPDDCSQTYPYWGGLATAPGCDPIFAALMTDLDPWRNAMQELLDGPFSARAMNDEIDRHVAFIQEEAEKEETPTMYTSFSNAVQEIRNTLPRLRERMELLIEQ